MNCRIHSQFSKTSDTLPVIYKNIQKGERVDLKRIIMNVVAFQL